MYCDAVMYLFYVAILCWNHHMCFYSYASLLSCMLCLHISALSTYTLYPHYLHTLTTHTGYQLTAMANRSVIVDNNTWNNTHIATVGRAMSSPEKTAWEVYRSLDVEYVLVVFGGWIGALMLWLLCMLLLCCACFAHCCACCCCVNMCSLMWTYACTCM